MNRKLPKSCKMQPQDSAVDAHMVGEVAQALADFRRLGLSPAPFNLVSPWSERVRVVRLGEFLLRPKSANHS